MINQVLGSGTTALAAKQLGRRFIDNIHINWTEFTEKRISRQMCPDCGKISYFVNFYQDWYGWHSTCMRCGRQWSDGEWIPLNFSPTARKKNIENARRTWENLKRR